LVGDGDGRPMIVTVATCTDSIRTIPILQHDPDRPEDVSEQKVLLVGFLTHQVMVGFGMRVGANTAEYFLQNLTVSQTNAGHGFSMC
jgi:hypothetical protein